LIRLRLHRRNRVAEHGEINRFPDISAGRECGQAGKVAAGGEADQPDPIRPTVPETPNLSPESVEGFGVPGVQRVPEHAGA
jgi:hypothetical protein